MKPTDLVPHLDVARRATPTPMDPTLINACDETWNAFQNFLARGADIDTALTLTDIALANAEGLP